MCGRSGTYIDAKPRSPAARARSSGRIAWSVENIVTPNCIAPLGRRGGQERTGPNGSIPEPCRAVSAGRARGSLGGHDGAAVDAQHLTGHERGVVAGKEHGGTGEVLGLE